MKIQSWSQGEAIPLDASAQRLLRARKHYSGDKQAAATCRSEEKDHHFNNKAASTPKIALNQHDTSLNWDPAALRDCKDLEMHKCWFLCNPLSEKRTLSVLTPSHGTSSKIIGIFVFILPGRTGGTWGGSREGPAVQRASSDKRRWAKDEKPPKKRT